MSKITSVIIGVLRGDPILVAEVVRILGAVSVMFGLGWTEDGISEGVGAVLMVGSFVLSFLARRKTTPALNPQPAGSNVVTMVDEEGNEQEVLVPVTKPVLTLKGWRF